MRDGRMNYLVSECQRFLPVFEHLKWMETLRKIQGPVNGYCLGQSI